VSGLPTDDECRHRFDQLRWDLQDITRALQDLQHAVKQTRVIARDIQSELDEWIRKGVS
jgi:hypothetical protein